MSKGKGVELLVALRQPACLLRRDDNKSGEKSGMGMQVLRGNFHKQDERINTRKQSFIR
jgi:hypothetical protein